MSNIHSNREDILTYRSNIDIWNWIAMFKDYKMGDKVGRGLTRNHAILALMKDNKQENYA